jgi:hypothetical protein
MDIRGFLLGSRDFKTPAEIVSIVRLSPEFDPLKESSEEPILIFQTSKQQTWLVATPERLYCVLDDIRRGFTELQWSTPKKDLVSNGKIIVPISTRPTHDDSERTGLLDIGKRRNWYFTKSLFASEPAESQVKRVIAKQMLG